MNKAISNKRRRMQKPHKTNHEVAEFSHSTCLPILLIQKPQKQHITWHFLKRADLSLRLKLSASQRKRPTATVGAVPLPCTSRWLCAASGLCSCSGTAGRPMMRSRSSSRITEGCLHAASEKASSRVFCTFSSLFP